MKAKELSEKDLMIGDWVMYNPNVFIEDEYESPKECYPTQIENGECLYWATEGCYSPIPLTPEIFEKNGFEKSYSSILTADGYKKLPVYTYKNTRQAQSIRHNLIKVCVSLDGSEYDVEFGIGSHIFDLEYVHEFQHALRLCGIEKEIIL